jgi:predicted Kef-type K+ transport protein
MNFFEEWLANPYYSGAIWLALVFFFGLGAQRLGLPPLVGFLLGGFVINLTEHNGEPLYGVVQTMADVGVMLLLFTIGLKLKLKNLIRPHIWGTALVHMFVVVVLFSGFVTLLSYFGLRYFTDISTMSALMIGFALSFSSTVYIVKSLENSGEMSSVHGKTAIGILIIQDIMAVIFMAISSGKSPSIWVLVLPLWLWILKRLLGYLLNTVGHGEMLQIFGFFATFIAGAFSFYGFGLKPDLGALIMGMLLVSHPKAEELYQKMIEYKDFFLIAFFVHVGLVGLPTWKTASIAAILMPLVVFKGVLFGAILSRFPIQKRSVYLASLSLSNFSEFGLIVGVVGLDMGLLSADWLVVMALMMSLSFLFASPIQRYSNALLTYFNDWIFKEGHLEVETVGMNPSQSKELHVEADFIVVGLGSIGKPVYDGLNAQFPNRVVGLDFDKDKVMDLEQKGYRVFYTDVSFGDVWNCVHLPSLKGVYFTMNDFNMNLNALEHVTTIQNRGFHIYALTPYSDHAQYYKSKGVDFVYNFKERLGADFVATTLRFKQENERL